MLPRISPVRHPAPGSTTEWPQCPRAFLVQSGLEVRGVTFCGPCVHKDNSPTPPHGRFSGIAHLQDLYGCASASVLRSGPEVRCATFGGPCVHKDDSPTPGVIFCIPPQTCVQDISGCASASVVWSGPEVRGVTLLLVLPHRRRPVRHTPPGSTPEWPQCP